MVAKVENHIAHSILFLFFVLTLLLSICMGLVTRCRKSRLGGPRGPGWQGACGLVGRYWIVLGALGFTCGVKK